MTVGCTHATVTARPRPRGRRGSWSSSEAVSSTRVNGHYICTDPHDQREWWVFQHIVCGAVRWTDLRLWCDTSFESGQDDPYM